MKRIVFISVTFLWFVFFANAQQYRIGTYNLRMDNAGDSGNLWKDRSKYLCDLIRYHQMDIVGTQEGFKHQLDDILVQLPYLTYTGRGRDDGKEAGEHSAIFYSKEKFSMINNGDFWLREDPAVPGKGWDATCCNRICSWVKLRDNNKKKRSFYIFNVHYDHQGVIARRESSKLILQKIKEIAGNSPVILTGDFNGSRASEAYNLIEQSTFLRDSHNEISFPYENNTSFNGFGKALKGNDIIDHIFITKQFKALSWAVLTDTYFGKFPSDHFPIMTVIKWE